MSSINVGHLYKKRTVRNLNGQVIDMVDEADGGVIIRRGQIVNQEKYDAIKRVEEDKKLAAQAVLHQVTVETEFDRTINPSEQKKSEERMEKLEERVDNMDSKLDKILNAINK